VDPDADATAADATETAPVPGSQTTLATTGDPATADPTVENPAVAQLPDGGTSRGHSNHKRRRGFVFELLWLVPVAVVAALLIKGFVFQAFYIPSGSMEPTLNIGDRVLVNKLSYDLHDVHRGDIIVFEAPPLARGNGIDDLVKRVIGLPGETVTYSGGSVLINGHRLSEPYLRPSATTEAEGGAVPPGCGAPPDGQAGCVVPKGRLFVLGDNRPQSKDARVFGPISESSIVGRVFVRIWPVDNLGLL
jgi:signal peptidase I